MAGRGSLEVLQLLHQQYCYLISPVIRDIDHGACTVICKLTLPAIAYFEGRRSHLAIGCLCYEFPLAQGSFL